MDNNTILNFLKPSFLNLPNKHLLKIKIFFLFIDLFMFNDIIFVYLTFTILIYNSKINFPFKKSISIHFSYDITF